MHGAAGAAGARTRRDPYQRAVSVRAVRCSAWQPAGTGGPSFCIVSENLNRFWPADYQLASSKAPRPRPLGLRPISLTSTAARVMSPGVVILRLR